MKPGAGHPTQAEYVRLLHCTLDGISAQAAGDDPQEISRLKSGLASLSSSIDERSTPEEIEAALTAGFELIRGLKLACAQRAADQIGELRSAMRAMTETITFLSESRTTAVHQLKHIERQLEEATEIEDFRFLRSRLTTCLELVREETIRLHAESAAHDQRIPRLGSLDRVTGLPGRGIGEQLLRDRVMTGKECSMALFVPERLASVTKRHGNSAEDEVLMYVAQHLAKQIPASVSLCRWTGPAFLVLAEARSGSGNPEHLWNQLADRHIEQTINLNRRTVLVRITLASVVKHVGPETSLGPLFQELDEFVATSTREP